MVEATIKTCPTCQKTKRSYQKYGHLPEKVAESQPWEKVCVDLIGPYTIKPKGQKKLILWCITMIDPATGWFEMRELKNKEAINVAKPDIPGPARLPLIEVQNLWLSLQQW